VITFRHKDVCCKYMLVFIRAVLRKEETSKGAEATGECFLFL
jgi:hypothetical protein